MLRCIRWACFESPPTLRLGLVVLATALGLIVIPSTVRWHALVPQEWPLTLHAQVDTHPLSMHWGGMYQPLLSIDAADFLSKAPCASGLPRSAMNRSQVHTASRAALSSTVRLAVY